MNGWLWLVIFCKDTKNKEKLVNILQKFKLTSEKLSMTNNFNLLEINLNKQR